MHETGPDPAKSEEGSMRNANGRNEAIEEGLNQSKMATLKRTMQRDTYILLDIPP